MIVRKSALKHGIDEADSVKAARGSVLAFRLDDENPQRQLWLGFDQKSRLLELVVLVWDDGTEEIIHAMRARPKYSRLLE